MQARSIRSERWIEDHYSLLAARTIKQAGHVQRLQHLLCSRLQKIDELHGKLEQLRGHGDSMRKMTTSRSSSQRRNSMPLS
jgi:hypothetical protein